MTRHVTRSVTRHVTRYVTRRVTRDMTSKANVAKIFLAAGGEGRGGLE